MREARTRKLIVLAAFCLSFLLTSSGEAADRKGQLKPEEQKVIDYLRGEWGKDHSITSIDVAMDAVGLKQSDETRFRIGSYIKAHPELHEAIRRFGWVTVVLTPDEKLIARTLVNAERDNKSAPGAADVAKAVGIKEDQVKRGLGTLERYEIIERNPSGGGAGYRVVPRYLKWEPRLDFIFHTVTVGRGKRFNVN